MTHTDMRWLRKVALAGMMAGLAACNADRAAAPTTGPLFDIHSGSSSGNPSKPWTGRSGSAAITAYALFGSGGANLTVTGYRATDTQFTTPVGCVNKIQAKVYRSGRLVSTQNFNNLSTGTYATVLVRGAQVGDQLSLQVNVSCIEPKRTDVVDADVDVIQANTTDPAVTQLSVPGTALAGASVTISAYVQVPRGLMAATGNCSLTLTAPDGSVRTLAFDGNPVTVVSGGSVLCAFNPPIPLPGGLYQVTVAFEFNSVTHPTDLHPANNSASTSMVVFVEMPKFEIAANLYDSTRTYHDVYLYSDHIFLSSSILDSMPTWGIRLDTLYTSTDSVRNAQHAQFNGIISAQVKFPLVSLTVSQVSGSTTYDSHSWTSVAADSGSSSGTQCAHLLTGTVTLLVCSDAPIGSNLYGETRISYIRDASAAETGSKLYQVDDRPGSAYPRSSCHVRSTDSTAQCYTIRSPASLPLVPYGDSYTFNVVLQDSTRRYTAVVTVPITAALLDGSEPYVCDYRTNLDETYGLMGTKTCQGLIDTRLRRAGEIENFLGLTQAVP